MKYLLIKTILILIVIFSNYQKIETFETEIENNTEIIGYIYIEKINLNKPLYSINSKHNNIEENITILKESIFPPNKNSIIFLIAHSGSSNISFFNNLNKLNLNDEITLSLFNKEYTYVVSNIIVEKKDGYLYVNKENTEQLILSTCNPTNNKYQLTINCIKKELNK